MEFSFMRRLFSGSPAELNPELLDAIHTRRFSASDKARLRALWTEMAQIFDIDPADLHETDRIDERCPRPRYGICFNGRLEDLSVLIQRESDGRPPPANPPVTVGDILDYLLER